MKKLKIYFLKAKNMSATCEKFPMEFNFREGNMFTLSKNLPPRSLRVTFNLVSRLCIQTVKNFETFLCRVRDVELSKRFALHESNGSLIETAEIKTRTFQSYGEKSD